MVRIRDVVALALGVAHVQAVRPQNLHRLVLEVEEEAQNALHEGTEGKASRVGNENWEVSMLSTVCKDDNNCGPYGKAGRCRDFECATCAAGKCFTKEAAMACCEAEPDKCSAVYGGGKHWWTFKGQPCNEEKHANLYHVYHSPGWTGTQGTRLEADEAPTKLVSKAFAFNPADTNACPDGYSKFDTEEACRTALDGELWARFQAGVSSPNEPGGCYKVDVGEDTSDIYFNDHTGAGVAGRTLLCRPEGTRAPKCSSICEKNKNKPWHGNHGRNKCSWSRCVDCPECAEDKADEAPSPPKPVTCECKQPGQGTVDKNGYKCSDGEEAHCAADQECFATAPFTKGKWADGCRIPEAEWALGEKGESCNAACAKSGRHCTGRSVAEQRGLTAIDLTAKVTKFGKCSSTHALNWNGNPSVNLVTGECITDGTAVSECDAKSDHWQRLCLCEADEVPTDAYHLARKGADNCDFGVTPRHFDCKAAAQAAIKAHGITSNGQYQESAWPHVPFGCSVREGNGKIQYSHLKKGKNNGVHQLVCSGSPLGGK